jgi:hypothetical protein
MARKHAALEIRPLDAKRWKDSRTLFNGRGRAGSRLLVHVLRRSGHTEVPPGKSRPEHNSLAQGAGRPAHRSGLIIAKGSRRLGSFGPREDFEARAFDGDEPSTTKYLRSVVCFNGEGARGEHVAEACSRRDRLCARPRREVGRAHVGRQA